VENCINTKLSDSKLQSAYQKLLTESYLWQTLTPLNLDDRDDAFLSPDNLADAAVILRIRVESWCLSAAGQEAKRRYVQQLTGGKMALHLLILIVVVGCCISCRLNKEGRRHFILHVCDGAICVICSAPNCSTFGHNFFAWLWSLNASRKTGKQLRICFLWKMFCSVRNWNSSINPVYDESNVDWKSAIHLPRLALN
jgi:hypothetical protein